MHPVKAAIRSYILLAIVFLLLIILLPANKIFLEIYNLTSQQYHILLLMVEIPVLAMWLGAFIGYGKLEQYAFKLIGTKEGDAYAKLSSGMRWLAYSMPIPTFLYFIISSYAGRDAGWQSASIIVSNYATLFLSLFAFLKASEATRMLRLQRKIHQPASSVRWLQLGFATLGVVYCYLIFKQVDLSTLSNAHNAYYLPVWLLVLTQIIPFLYAWFLGLLTAFDMWLVASRSPGFIYRKGILMMAAGLVVVIAARIGEQYSVSVIPASGHYSVNHTLGFLYVLYILSILGFTAFIFGVNRLIRLEEV